MRKTLLTLLLLTACGDPPPAAPPAPTPAPPPAPPPAPTPTPAPPPAPVAAVEAAPDPRWPALEATEAGAVALGEEARRWSQDAAFGDWLKARAGWPLDLDGAALVEGPGALTAALEAHLKGFGERAAAQERCRAITREALLGGAPWPALDRLGARAPGDELRRDLDRLGLRAPGDWWVHCSHEGAAGYTVLASPDKTGVLRLRALRD